VREKRAVLMEGYLDVARALEQGVTEVVATCGTALTGSHARLIKRFAETVVLNFDQDEAGQKAARKSLEVLLEEELRVRIVELPEGHDPDTFLKAEGADAYRKRLDEAPEAVEWLMRRAIVRHPVTTPAGKAAFFADVLPALVRTVNAVERQAWLARVVERGGLDLAAAREELRRALSGKPARGSAVAEAAARTPGASRTRGLLPAERWLLALVAQGAAGVENALDELQEADLEGLRSAALLRAAQSVARRDERVTLAAVVAELDEEARRMMSQIAVEGAPAEHLTAEECVRVLRLLPLEARMAEIQKSLAGASGEAENALLAEKIRLRRQMAEL
jgi:DNA primase